MSSSSYASMDGAEAARFVHEQNTDDPDKRWPAALSAALNLISASPECMLLVWGPERLLFLNDACCAALVIDPRQAWGQPGASVPGLSWHSLRPLLEQALTGQSSKRQHLRIQAGSTQQMVGWLSCSPLPGEHGRIEGAFALLDVLAGQDEAPDRSGPQQNFDRRVLASINDCIKVLDMDGRLVFMSEGGQRLMEVVDFNAVRGGFWPDYLEEQSRPDAMKALAIARSGQSTTFTGSARTMGGSLKWWHVQVSPVLDERGCPEKILSVSRDITQLHSAEESLRELNDSLEQRVRESTRDRDRIWQLSTDLMLVAHFNGIIHALNPAWSHTLGWSAEQLAGSQFLDLLHPDDLASTRAAMTRLESGMSISNFKNRYRHADGTYRTIAWTAVPDQQFIHAVGRDIQAQEDAGEALRLSEETLRQAQKLEAIGQLTGGVAHDFNNLLTIIKSCSDLLMSTHLCESRRNKYVQAISATVDRAARLTGQLLAFARRQALQPAVFDINESVARIGEMMDTLTGSRVQVHLQLPAEPCHIHADGSQFDTALINMIVNARDAMAGVGQLSIGVGRHANLAASPMTGLAEGDYVTVTLTDTGSGIAPDKLALIFEPFYTTKAVGQGTGLGLSQVFGFAKQSGGEVVVHSELGKGSCFTLYLPSASQLPELRPQPVNAIAANTALRVLMVEDNPQIGTYTSAMLEQSGFSVLWVPGAHEALHELAHEPERFDVVFSDIAMPGMNGIELYAAIERAWPWLPVILTTGYSTEFAGFSRDEAQRFDLLQKPYRAEELCARLQDRVASHRHTPR